MNKDITDILIKAKMNKVFNSEEEFREILNKIKNCHEKIIIDWDDGAGEEWARIIYQDLGVVGMIHSKIGVLFISKDKQLNTIKDNVASLNIVEVDDFDKKEWFINIDNVNNLAPQLNWCVSDSAIDFDNFCLSDFYVVTV